MSRLFPCLLVGAALLVSQGSCGDAPAKNSNWTAAPLPVGKWKVEFTNGVIEECDVFVFDGGGHATVDEPLRKSRGTVVAKGDSVVMNFNDDRVERWTPAGKRFVVEHWFPGSRFLTAAPVLGIAERAP